MRPTLSGLVLLAIIVAVVATATWLDMDSKGFEPAIEITRHTDVLESRVTPRVPAPQASATLDVKDDSGSVTSPLAPGARERLAWVAGRVTDLSGHPLEGFRLHVVTTPQAAYSLMFAHLLGEPAPLAQAQTEADAWWPSRRTAIPCSWCTEMALRTSS